MSCVKGRFTTRRHPGATFWQVSSKYSKEQLDCEFLLGRGPHEDAPTGDLAHRRLSLVGPALFRRAATSYCCPGTFAHQKTPWSNFPPSLAEMYPEVASVSISSRARSPRGRPKGRLLPAPAYLSWSPSLPSERGKRTFYHKKTPWSNFMPRLIQIFQGTTSL